MGEIVGVGVLSHTPTIMLPQHIRYEENEGKEITLVPGLHRLRDEVLDRLAPDVVIVFDTHWFSTVEFIITGHQRRRGKYTSEELPRGMAQVPYDLRGDAALAEMIADEARAGGIPCIANSDDCLPIHYPTINLAHYLAREEAWLSVSVCQTAQDKEFLALGEALGRAVSRADARRVVLIASGGMSHRFWPLSALGQHASCNPDHIRTPEARAADEQRLDWWRNGDHASVIDAMDDYRQHKPEGMFAHYLMMVSAVGGRQCRAIGEQYSEYESSAGTGQVHVWFERPEQGWAA